MPRNPVAGIVSGAFGLAWAALGLVLGAWVAVTMLDAAQGLELGRRVLDESPFDLPWRAVDVASIAVEFIVFPALIAALALLLAWSNLRTARIAFRPRSESQDGKGQLQLAGRGEARVGKPVEGAILLRDAPAPGEEFDVVLAGGSAAAAYRAEQRVRARQGAHGVSLPFRFDVPATAAPSGIGSDWRLEFARAGKKAFPSWIELELQPGAPEQVAPVRAAAAESAPARGHAEHLASLAEAFGVKMSPAQRQRLHDKLSEPGAPANARQLEMFRQLTPQHVKYIKYGLIAFFVLFFLMPFVLSVITLVLGGIFA